MHHGAEGWWHEAWLRNQLTFFDFRGFKLFRIGDLGWLQPDELKSKFGPAFSEVAKEVELIDCVARLPKI